jgi:hypothetical protein
VGRSAKQAKVAKTRIIVYSMMQACAARFPILPRLQSTRSRPFRGDGQAGVLRYNCAPWG